MIKTNIKMRVTPEQSEAVQKICFANGIFFSVANDKISYTEAEYLFIEHDRIWYRGYSDHNIGAETKGYTEVDASFFISTSGTCIEETPEQALKQNINKEETMEKNEVETYKDVKEYLIAKGLYERVLEIDWDYGGEPTEFSELFFWDEVEEGYAFWNAMDDDLIKLGIEENIKSLVQDYKAKQGKEFIKHLEAQPEEAIEEKPKPTSYTNAKEYLIAKGLYEDVLSFNLEFNGYAYYFGNMFWFKETPQGYEFWNKISSELKELKISSKINEILEDYEVRKLEAIETKPLEKPKQYLCYVQGKALPKHIHKTLEQAKQEAQRLCRKELAKVSVLEVVAEFEAEVLVKEVL